jgi:hypothetical protein
MHTQSASDLGSSAIVSFGPPSHLRLCYIFAPIPPANRRSTCQSGRTYDPFILSCAELIGVRESSSSLGDVKRQEYLNRRSRPGRILFLPVEND